MWQKGNAHEQETENDTDGSRAWRRTGADRLLLLGG